MNADRKSPLSVGMISLLIVSCLSISVGLGQGKKDGALPTTSPITKGAQEAIDGNQETKDALPKPKPEKITEEFVSTIDNLKLNRLLELNGVNNWIILSAAVLAGLILGRFVSFLLRRIRNRLREKNWRVIGHVIGDLASPISLVLLTTGIWVGVAQLKMDGELRDFCTNSLVFLYSIALVWFIFNLVGVVDVALRRQSSNGDSPVDQTVIDLVRKSARLFVVVISILFIAENVVGANITSWLAGLGLIGLAVSLAAQDSLKNIFGSLTIYLDKPFGIGDLVEYTDVMGVVEQIGFRSTTIRSLDGPLLVVPNNKIVSDPVKNVSRRTFIRRKLQLALPYSTRAEQMQQAMEIVGEIVKLDDIQDAIQHDDGDGFVQSPQIFFSDLNADHLELALYYWHKPGDWWEYQAHATRVNLELMRRFNEAGLEFAFPTQTVHLLNSTSKSPSKSSLIDMRESDEEQSDEPDTKSHRGSPTEKRNTDTDAQADAPEETGDSDGSVDGDGEASSQ